MSHQEEDVILVRDDNEKQGWTWSLSVFLVSLWIILGLLARIWSVVCFGLEGSFQDKWLGFLTAMIMGPFYWLFYSLVPSDYCTIAKQKAQKKQQVKQQVKVQMKKNTKSKPSK